MTGYTDTSARAALDALITSYPWLALFSTMGADDGTGFVEVAFGTYARVNTTGLWSAATGSAPATKQNNATIQFTTATTAGLAAIGIGLYTAATAGTLGFSSHLGAFNWQPATFSLASPSVISVPAHGFANGDSVVCTTEYGSEGTIPAGLLTGLLTVANVTTDTFTVGVNATVSTGGLMVRKVLPQATSIGIQVQFLSGQLVLSFV